jgi:hypothetical protein
MSYRKSHPFATYSAAIISTIFASSVSADITKEIEDALSFYDNGNKGALKMDLRYRYENVNQDLGNQRTANANTARLRLGYLTPTFYDLQAFAEYEGNYAMQEDYNSLRNGRTQYSVVPDPDKNELNQFWLSYKGIPDTLVKVGRQRIKLDDDRFIGNVGWRQMEMTYDSILFDYKPQFAPGLTAKLGYIDSARTIISTKEKMNTPILNLNYKVGEWGTLIGYGYWLDYYEQENYAKSSQTYGLGFEGESPKIYDTVSAIYDVEWSTQSDYGDNPNSYQVDRIKLLGGATAFDATVSGAMEQLNGQGQGVGKTTKAFQTPLGTNHAFQGWADLFLTTPADGIRDVYATADYKMMDKSLIFTGVYHDFFDDTGVTHYGNEWDFSVLKKFGKHYSLLAKYAYYNADSFGTDTQKIWLEADVSF